jgi:hypothetical protein
VRNVRAVSLKNAPFKILAYYDDVMFFYFVSTDLTGSGHICPFLLALGFIRDRWL